MDIGTIMLEVVNTLGGQMLQPINRDNQTIGPSQRTIKVLQGMKMCRWYLTASEESSGTLYIFTGYN